ncbi:FKBP-type peptidyl-prolyl cis-trans isomerase [Methylogaea oryzae]|uniref:Peptidyl-prolyl cis-trans isomerase n=1 Tax=Methylogaea oryzae TaxID=1295382 RepID=A0A8D5ANW8_9GAMM|nr:FKBP-type peptidyl-prolyl cis-trans isomerase [Methylogaea oryzae]BBL72510.1 hypothetical protein MoryE10_31160 [Methylogaea oryzae]
MNKPVKTLRLLTLICGAALSLAGCTVGDPEENLRQSQAYLENNAKQPGVITTASGLQYRVIKEGTGIKPAVTDNVTVDYRGSLVNGTEFDAGNGVSFPLDGVIPGWQEGVQLMKEGAEYEFTIPAELAYGAGGTGRAIGPNMALIFNVTLVKVNR